MGIKPKSNQRSVNWKRPRPDDVVHEYKIEYLLHIQPKYGDIFPTLGHFKLAVENAPVVKITPQIDKRIHGRSHTASHSQLLDLIRGYASYPKYRNEETLKALEARIKNGSPVSMPIVLKFKTHMRIMGGNTRMDIGFWYGKTVSVLMVDART